MKPLAFLLFLLVILTFSLHAQKKGYFKGYVINIEGDTLHVLIKDKSSGPFTELYSNIRFKSKKPRIKRKELNNASEVFKFYSDMCNGPILLTNN